MNLRDYLMEEIDINEGVFKNIFNKLFQSGTIKFFKSLKNESTKKKMEHIKDFFLATIKLLNTLGEKSDQISYILMQKDFGKMVNLSPEEHRDLLNDLDLSDENIEDEEY